MDALRWQTLVFQGITLQQGHDQTHWQLGDLAVEIETSYGAEELFRFAEAIGVSYGALRDDRWVAGQFADRSADLPWSAYRVVAGRRDAATWIDRARLGRWTVGQLRTAVREAGNEPAPPAAPRRQVAPRTTASRRGRTPGRATPSGGRVSADDDTPEMAIVVPAAVAIFAEAEEPIDVWLDIDRAQRDAVATLCGTNTRSCAFPIW